MLLARSTVTSRVLCQQNSICSSNSGSGALQWSFRLLNVCGHTHVMQPQPRKGLAGTAAAAERVSAAAAGFWTLAEPYTLEVEIKKSRFIAFAWPVKSQSEALEHIAASSGPTASHNCWAFKVAGSARSNDDGEPSGTAGKPILRAIEGDGLDGVAVLVVRHFGGTKLGAGGLARAYGGAARDCVRAAQKEFVKAQAQLTLDSPFDCLGSVYSILAKYDATAGTEEYTDRGKVRLMFSCDTDVADTITLALADATGGKVKACSIQQQG